MLAQFQAKYPGGSLVSELLTIHEGKYVVKVLAQIDGKTLMTALAAADTVEDAEDRARARVLAACDIDRSASQPVSPPSSTPPISPTTAPPKDDFSWQEESPPTMPKLESFQEPTWDTESNAPLEDEDTQPTPASGSTSGEMVDLSDIIVQTDIEMRRLGWGKEQGRHHLESTYNKRSRQQLTEAELRSFLDYLRSLPTP